MILCTTVIVNVGQLVSLIDGRVRCRCYDGYMSTQLIKTEGLATSIHMTCDGCREVEVWEADESRVLFTPSRNKTTSALTVRMVFAMMAVGMARTSCNMILSTLNIKVYISYSRNTSSFIHSCVASPQCHVSEDFSAPGRDY